MGKTLLLTAALIAVGQASTAQEEPAHHEQEAEFSIKYSVEEPLDPASIP